MSLERPPMATGPKDAGRSSGLSEPKANGKPAKPITIKTLRKMADRAEPFACLACYDAITARWLERAGVHLLLAGDSAAEIVLGLPRTIHMPMELSIWLTAALKRGAPNTVVMADMPFLSYHAGEDEALKNAGRFMTEGLADIVKLEADASFAPLVERYTRAGIPVCAHVGSLPQRSAMRGGYGSAGRTADEARKIVDDAIALEQAGSVMLLVEAVPDQVSQAIMDRTSIPLIGIGAGPACHGQILVLHDLLGLTDHAPRFAEPVAAMGKSLQDAGATWVASVAKRQIGGRPYEMPPSEAKAFQSGLDD